MFVNNNSACIGTTYAEAMVSALDLRQNNEKVRLTETLRVHYFARHCNDLATGRGQLFWGACPVPQSIILQMICSSIVYIGHIF